MISDKETVLVIYGGVSPEHEVAIVTALQVMNALAEGGFKVRPLYISKIGHWFLGDKRYLKPEIYKDLSKVEGMGKRLVYSPDGDIGLLSKSWLGFSPEVGSIDVVFPVIHGRGGEDGTIQGLLELSGVPYVGCGVTASAIKIDKYIAKRLAESVGIKTTKDKLVSKGEEIDQLPFKFPVYVKPVGLGSSIGLARVDEQKNLKSALEVAFCYDNRVMIEEAIETPKEVNISIMGNGPKYEVSVTERPVSSGKMLSFEDKYIRDDGGKNTGMAGANRIIPADIGIKMIREIEDNARKFFRLIGGKGMARIDFMIDKDGKIYFNEINTLPGSLAFYLWEKKGVIFSELVEKLVNLAIENWKAKKELITSFENNILSGLANGGLKGKKF